METNSLPVLTHTEELKTKLEHEFHNVSTLMWAELMCYDGGVRDNIYKGETEGEKGAIYDLLDKFREECKSNFLLIDGGGLRNRHYYLLHSNFDFLTKVGKEIKKYMDEFWERFDADQDTGVYRSKYHNSLNDWANFLTQDVLDEIQEIFDLYNSYGVNTTVSYRVHKPTTSTHTQQPEPIEPEPTEPSATDLNVKILLAYQSGILDGTFNRLPPEKQYNVLSLLFGKSKANVKNALTALYGDANTEKNPKNLPSIVEKTNNLITKKDLGIPLVLSRKKQ